MLAPPICHLAEIDLAAANSVLRRWGHRMGPVERPDFGDIWAHGLFLHGELAAVAVTAGLIRERCGGLTRREAVELARICADRPTLCRVILRLWRECVFPALAERRGWRWAISYQDAVMHRGNLYRHDGWRRIGTSRSGTDPRSGRKGRQRVIWGWEVVA